MSSGGRRAGVLWALLVATSLAGCSPESRQRTLVFLFEDVPSPDAAPGTTPLVRRPRRPPPPTAAPTPTPAFLQTEAERSAALRTWDDVARRLPKDPLGNPDWSRALEQGIIAPRPGIEPRAEEQAVLALDVEISRPGDSALAVVFSHRKHGEWLSCDNCHTALFAMKSGETSMAAGEAHGERRCGACHGKVAFDVVSGCPLCHLRTFPKDAQGQVDWNRALAESRIVPGSGPRSAVAPVPILDLDVALEAAQPTFSSVFSHRAHTQWLSCGSCHPRPFPQEAGGLNGADLHSREYCGACHGSVAFGLTGACERCHPAFRKEKHHNASLDLDVEITPKASPSTTRTVFSHKIHTPWVECSVCHSDVYAPTAPAERPAMADLYTGKYCASCHGKIASELTARCQPCHVAGDAR